MFRVPFIVNMICYHESVGITPHQSRGSDDMLNFCLFIFIFYAVSRIVNMITRPAEFYTVFKRRR